MRCHTSRRIERHPGVWLRIPNTPGPKAAERQRWNHSRHSTSTRMVPPCRSVSRTLYLISAVSSESVEVEAKCSQTSRVGKPQREVDPFRDELAVLRRALGTRIRELRKLKAWSQEEFADKAHVHRTFAGSLERGEKNVSFHALVLIARCFDMTLSEFVEGLENGESASTGPLHRIPKARGDHAEMDRRRVLKEVAALEQTVRSLKEIATTQGERSVAAKGPPKRQRRKAGSKS